jgi:hypothetical protein
VQLFGRHGRAAVPERPDRRRGLSGRAGARGLAVEIERRERSDALAEKVVERGLAAQGTVQEALSQLVWAAVRELVGWRDGEFAFNRDDGAGEPRLAVSVDPQEVLLEVFREMDEASRRGAPAPTG